MVGPHDGQRPGFRTLWPHRHSEDWQINKGDLAMLDVTVQRIRARRPGATSARSPRLRLLVRSDFPECDSRSSRGRDGLATGRRAGTGRRRAGPAVVGP